MRGCLYVLECHLHICNFVFVYVRARAFVFTTQLVKAPLFSNIRIYLIINRTSIVIIQSYASLNLAKFSRTSCMQSLPAPPRAFMLSSMAEVISAGSSLRRRPPEACVLDAMDGGWPGSRPTLDRRQKDQRL